MMMKNHVHCSELDRVELCKESKHKLSPSALFLLPLPPFSMFQLLMDEFLMYNSGKSNLLAKADFKSIISILFYHRISMLTAHSIIIIILIAILEAEAEIRKKWYLTQQQSISE
jgi:hypothetical protein